MPMPCMHAMREATRFSTGLFTPLVLSGRHAEPCAPRPTPSGRRTGPRPEITCRVRGPARASGRRGAGRDSAGPGPAAGGRAATRRNPPKQKCLARERGGGGHERRLPGGVAGNKDRVPRLVGFDSAPPIPHPPSSSPPSSVAPRPRRKESRPGTGSSSPPCSAFPSRYVRRRASPSSFVRSTPLAKVSPFSSTHAAGEIAPSVLPHWEIFLVGGWRFAWLSPIGCGQF